MRQKYSTPFAFPPRPPPPHTRPPASCRPTPHSYTVPLITPSPPPPTPPTSPAPPAPPSPPPAAVASSSAVSPRTRSTCNAIAAHEPNDEQHDAMCVCARARCVCVCVSVCVCVCVYAHTSHQRTTPKDEQHAAVHSAYNQKTKILKSQYPTALHFPNSLKASFSEYLPHQRPQTHTHRHIHPQFPPHPHPPLPHAFSSLPRTSHAFDQLRSTCP
jgi:hypothetical protein